MKSLKTIIGEFLDGTHGESGRWCGVVRLVGAGLVAGALFSAPWGLQAQDSEESEIEEQSPWEKSAGLGLTLTTGNSETALFTADVVGTRSKDKNELTLGASAAYGENSGETTSESLKGYAQFNRLISERIFSYGRLQALHDGVSDVDYRLTLGPGFGYHFIKNPKATLSAEIGPTLVYEKLSGEDGQGYLSVRLAENYKRRLSERARVWQSLDVLPQLDDFDNFILEGEIGVEADLTEKFSLRSYIQDTYDNQPARGRKKNDLKFVTSIAYKF